jgi:hypothetical protein
MFIFNVKCCAPYIINTSLPPLGVRHTQYIYSCILSLLIGLVSGTITALNSIFKWIYGRFACNMYFRGIEFDLFSTIFRLDFRTVLRMICFFLFLCKHDVKSNYWNLSGCSLISGLITVIVKTKFKQWWLNFLPISTKTNNHLSPQVIQHTQKHHGIYI